MSKCDLEIHLEKADRTYAPGETIRGHVKVRVDSDVQCKGLSVTQQWRTHGKGNRDKGSESRVQLSQGAWRAGELHAVAFEVIAPAGPASYHGTVVNVDHYLTARADLPWALDPKTEVEVLITPEPEAAAYDFGPSYKPPTAELSGQGKATAFGSALTLGCFGLPGLAIMVGGVALGVAWARGTSQEVFPAIFIFLFGVVFAAAGFGVAFMLQKRNLAQRKLGNPLVSVSPDVAHPGDVVSVQVTLQPPTSLRLTWATAVLRCREVAVSGSGTNRTTHDSDVHDSQATLGGPLLLEAGRPVSFSASLQLPKDAPTTFVASDNAVRWTVTLAVVIEGWPDWERQYPITVRP